MILPIAFVHRQKKPPPGPAMQSVSRRGYFVLF